MLPPGLLWHSLLSQPNSHLASLPCKSTSTHDYLVRQESAPSDAVLTLGAGMLMVRQGRCTRSDGEYDNVYVYMSVLVCIAASPAMATHQPHVTSKAFWLFPPLSLCFSSSFFTTGCDLRVRQPHPLIRAAVSGQRSRRADHGLLDLCLLHNHSAQAEPDTQGHKPGVSQARAQLRVDTRAM